MSSKKKSLPKMVLFFSFNVSLRIWEQLGMIDRESDYWKLMSKNFSKTCFISYGNRNDRYLQKQFPGIAVHYNPGKMNRFLYLFMIPILFRKCLMEADIYKVNQVSGSLPAVIAKILYKKKLVARCGFQLSIFFRRQKERRSKILLVILLEWLTYMLADLVVVTTEADKNYVLSHYPVSEKKIQVIPNGINTDIFKPMDQVSKEEGRVLFVGRLIPQKNLFALIKAFQDLPQMILHIVGQGPLKNQLVEYARKNNVQVVFKDRVSNSEMPFEMNKSQIFVLPSLYEGHPKVLLEAMACGIPVIGTKVIGIKEIIRHRENGLLCGTSVHEIRDAISILSDDDVLAAKISMKGRHWVEENFTLKALIAKEYNQIRSLT